MHRVGLRVPGRLGPRSRLREGLAVRARVTAGPGSLRARAGRAMAAASSSALPQPSPVASPPAARPARACPLRPPTWRGPFVSAAFRPFVPGHGVTSSGELAGPFLDGGPVPGNPVTVTRSGRSPFFKPALPHTSASQLGSSKASEHRRGRRSFCRKPRVYCPTLKCQPRVASRH